MSFVHPDRDHAGGLFQLLEAATRTRALKLDVPSHQHHVPADQGFPSTRCTWSGQSLRIS